MAKGFYALIRPRRISPLKDRGYKTTAVRYTPIAVRKVYKVERKAAI